MKTRITRFLLFVIAIFLGNQYSFAQYKIEFLDRGLVAVKVDDGVYLSWRVLGTDSDDTYFNLYRDGSLIYTSSAGEASNYTDADGTTSSSYEVKAVEDGAEQSAGASSCDVWSSNCLTIQLDRPDTGDSGGTYSPNDCSVGDVDGDGQWEIIVKWDPSNSKDNSQSGKTDKVYLDCYEMDGTKLWRIDLGWNIRAGAHYTQFLVGDYDADGYAEVVAKTSEGTMDGTGSYLSTGPAEDDDDSQVYRNSKGYILTGPEYLTIFNGLTGAEMQTIEFNPLRGTVSGWGDSYGNRVDRFNAMNAYLDGEKPSIVYGRGYYTRMAITAWDWDGTNLSQRWYFNAASSSDGGYGDGNHNWTCGDVDNDGKDEIIQGACAIDDDGSLMYALGWGHGDAIHMGEMDLDNDGLEVWGVYEDKLDYGYALRDAASGTLLWGEYTGTDVGRGVAADVDGDYVGYEMWSSANWNTYDKDGNIISTSRPSYNFRIYWDGDLYDELLDGTSLTKWTGSGNTTLESFEGNSCNSTKQTPNLSGDIIGDWREEVILHDGESKLYVYTTITPTDYRVYTLMHDPMYRNAISWQQSSYNQPPHISWLLSQGEDAIPTPNIELVMDAFNIKPEVELLEPTGDVTVPFQGPLELSASASDEDGTIARVDYYAGTELIGSSTTEPYSFTWTGMASGIYEVKAVAVDDMGGKGSSETVKVIVTAGTYIYENESGYADWTDTTYWTPTGYPGYWDTAIVRTGEVKIYEDKNTHVIVESDGIFRMIGNYTVPEIELQGGTIKVHTSNTAYGLTSSIDVQDSSTIFAGSQTYSIFWLEGTLTGTGNLTKIYPGILDLNVDASEYTGNWYITEGSFRISNSNSIGFNYVTMTGADTIHIEADDMFIFSVDLDDAICNLDYDLEVREFIINGVSLDPGTYTASDYPSSLIGTGTLTVTGTIDCAGVDYGTAYYDNCGECVGGTTGDTACIQDCNGDWGGTALIDDCEICSGGNTGITACDSQGQAEDACSYDGTVDSDNEGYSGDGFVNTTNESGSAISFNLYAYTAGTYSFSIIYANGGSASRPMTFSANGTDLTLDFDTSGGWTTWIAQEVEITLAEGANACTLTSDEDNGGPNIDKFIFYTDQLTLGSCETDCNGVYGGLAYYDDCNDCVGGDTGLEACEVVTGEAEDVSCSYDGEINSDNEGFTGTGFVNGDNSAGTAVTFKLYTAAARTIEFGIVYANGGSTDRPAQILVNGTEAVASFSMPVTAWTDYQSVFTDLTLESGLNEITLVALSDDGFANFDAFLVNGDATFSSCDAVTQSIDLIVGWNLVSLYLTPEDSLAGSVFPNATAIKTLDEFYYTSQDTFLNTLTEIEAGTGYLVYNTIAETITISGIVKTGYTLSLQDGLNLVGCPFTESTTIENAFDTESDSIQSVKSFDGEWTPDGTQTINSIEPGKAYFIIK